MHTQRKGVQVDLSDHELKPRSVDGKELVNWNEGPNFFDYLKQLTDEGWCLTGSSSGRELLFERQLP